MGVIIVIRQQKRFLCLGLIMRDILLSGVPELPSHWEQTLVGKAVKSDTGGGAANSARTLGRLGVEVCLSGRVGRDSFAHAVEEDLKQDGVDLAYLKADETLSSGVAVALIGESGKRCFTTVRGANQVYGAEDLREVPWNEFGFVHINGYFQFPSLEPELPSLLEQVKEAGCTVSFDTASWDPSGRWYESIHPFARYIDYFFANAAQLFQLTGEQDPREAAVFLRREGVGCVVAKLGEQGSVTFLDGEEVLVSSYPVEAVDTTGAGDSFDAAYMYGVAQGWSQRECGQFANTVAGLNCTRIGATAGVPDLETALELSKKHYSLV